MATWNKLNVDATALSNNATGTASKSLYIGNYSGSPVMSIYGGNYSTGVLGDPVTNASKVFFDSRFDYLRVKKVVDFTLSLPARNRRATGGGKKGGSGYLSYNGYADHYIYQHDYGSPPPAFTLFVKPDAGNGSIANHGITGSIPLQFISGSSFRLGLTYSTEKYLVLRERYQVYSNDIPALSLTVRAHFFENPTSVSAATSLDATASPNTFDQLYAGGYVWNGARPPAGYATPRYLYTTITVTAQLGQTFNQVTIDRTGGVNTQYTGQDTGHYIDQINGSNVTVFDCLTSRTTLNYTQSTSWSMRVVTKTTGANADFAPTWRIGLINTATGAKGELYVGGIHRFTR